MVDRFGRWSDGWERGPILRDCLAQSKNDSTCPGSVVIVFALNYFRHHFETSPYLQNQFFSYIFKLLLCFNSANQFLALLTYSTAAF